MATAGWQKWTDENQSEVGDTVLVILKEPINGTKIHTLHKLHGWSVIAGQFVEGDDGIEILYWRTLHDTIKDLAELIERN